MHDSLRRSIESVLEKMTGKPAHVRRVDACEGGCINHASVLTLDDGRRFFAKWNPSPLPRLFECEAEGLRALAQVNAVRVPAPICTAADIDDSASPFIVMEYIAPGRRGPAFFEELGRQFATLHRNGTAPQFGFPHDNYLGSTPQPNAWNDDWVDFWRNNRLGHLLGLLHERKQTDREVDQLADRLLERLPELIAQPDEPPCLLHGDLWGGNYLADENGGPVLIDPAAYFGRREADLAMTLLFGGFDKSFYAAYNEAWPLADGADARLDVYKLYHLLNHLLIFGQSYCAACVAILRRYATP